MASGLGYHVRYYVEQYYGIQGFIQDILLGGGGGGGRNDLKDQ